MSDDLRERVASAIAECRTAATRRGMWNQSQEHDFADAAISLILEEAANEAETHLYGHQAAAAIRALGKKESTNG